MKILFVFPFLALFGVPLAWETNVWHSHPFVSGMKTESEIRDDSTSSTTTVAARPLMYERTRLPRTASQGTPHDASLSTPGAPHPHRMRTEDWGNIFNPEYAHVGIGAWHDGMYTYFTTIFADQP